MTSDDPASGSRTVFQSSRLARPQDASKASDLLSLMSSSARLYLDTHKQCVLRSVSDVAHMEKSRWVPVGRYVDPVFKHSRRHNVGFIREKEKAGSVGFVETAEELFGLCYVAKKAGAQRFIIDAPAVNRHVFRIPFWTVVHRRGSLPC